MTVAIVPESLIAINFNFTVHNRMIEPCFRHSNNVRVEFKNGQFQFIKMGQKTANIDMDNMKTTLLRGWVR